jgi:hypothetical protein
MTSTKDLQVRQLVAWQKAQSLQSHAAPRCLQLCVHVRDVMPCYVSTGTQHNS